MYALNTCLSTNPHSAVNFQKWQSMVNLMAKMYGAACGTVVQLRDGEFNPVVTSLNEDNFLHRDLSWPWEMKSFCRHMMETREGLYIANALIDSNWSDAPPVEDGPVRSYCGLPIFWPDGSLFGSICVIDVKETQYESTLIELMEQMRHIISSDLQSIVDFEMIQTLAFTDDQTGVFNRRGLKNNLNIDTASAIGVVYFDIDNLKDTNDQCGHQEGDKRISTFADLLKNHCRKGELIARLGGDEFILLMLDVTEKELESCCHRISQQYQMIEINSCSIKPSVSYGYKLFQGDQLPSIDSMISQTDQLMYQHKRIQKNLNSV